MEKESVKCSDDVASGSKRSRDEESEEKNESMEESKEEEDNNNNNYPLLRDRYECIHMSLDHDFTFNPPEIAQFLDFFAEREKEEIRILSNGISQAEFSIDIIEEKNEIDIRYFRIQAKFMNDQIQIEEIEKCAEELGKIVTEDPRQGNLLDERLLILLVRFLGQDEKPRLKLHAATILKPVVAYSSNNAVVMKYIRTPVLVNLIRSEDCEVRVQGIWLLRTIALRFPLSLPVKTMLREALVPLTSFFIDGSPDHEVLFSGSMALAAVCQVLPELPPHQLEFALLAFKNLLQYESSEIFPSACSGLAYLCDNSQAVIFKDEYLETLIDRLIVLIDSESRVKTIAGLETLGSIVRWGRDHQIEVIIKKDTLWSLECLLGEKDAYYVKPACWILSNITARKQNHIESVICCECIDSLVGVLQNYELLEVKKEAALAILNAIFGANADQIKRLLKCCAKPLWNSLKVFSDNLDILSACLEGLVKLKGVEVTCNGALIDDVELKKYLFRLRGRQFQLADDHNSGELPKSKKLRTTDNIGKYDGDIELHLTCTFKEGLKPDSLTISVHNVNLGNVRLDSANMAVDQMEVELPR